MTGSGSTTVKIAILVVCLLVGFPGSVAMAVDVKGSVTLNQRLAIEAGWARAFIQLGKPVKYRQLDHFHPYCSIEIRQVAQQEDQYHVKPGRFDVIRIQNRRPTGLLFRPFPSSRWDDPGPVEHRVDFYLQSNQQPQVIRLACVKTLYDGWRESFHINEMQATLHPLVDLSI